LPSFLASRLVISSQVGACPVKALPFEDHPSTDKPEKQAPGKADQETIGNDTPMEC